MPKNIEDMIVPERRRSIRNIPIPEGRRKTSGYSVPPPVYSAPSIPTVPPVPTPSEAKHYESDFHRNGARFPRMPRKGVWIAAGVSILILLFAILSIFNGATFAYVPKSIDISFNKDAYTAEKSGEGKLLYSVIKLSEDKGLKVSASGEEQVSRKASGVIVVYNTTNKTQKFRSTTRFKTPEGNVYQVPDAIVVPAQKGSEPGSLEVTVFAEFPGAESNIGLADFTLPGLSGTSLASAVYARSKTEMTGGFVGVERVVSEKDKTRVTNDLQTTLKEGLISEAKAQAPEGFVLFPSLSSITFEELPQTEADKNSTTLNMRANLYGVMFKENDLSTHLTAKKADLAVGDTIDIVGLESLELAFTDTAPEDLLLSDKIDFSVSGVAKALWVIDETALRADLVGKHKRDIPSILNNYPNIESVNATIRPFWKGSFPDNSKDIVIKKLDVK